MWQSKIIIINFIKKIISIFFKPKPYKLHISQFLSYFIKNLMNLSSYKTYDSNPCVIKSYNVELLILCIKCDNNHFKTKFIIIYTLIFTK